MPIPPVLPDSLVVFLFAPLPRSRCRRLGYAAQLLKAFTSQLGHQASPLPSISPHLGQIGLDVPVTVLFPLVHEPTVAVVRAVAVRGVRLGITPHLGEYGLGPLVLGPVVNLANRVLNGGQQSLQRLHHLLHYACLQCLGWYALAGVDAGDDAAS